MITSGLQLQKIAGNADNKTVAAVYYGKESGGSAIKNVSFVPVAFKKLRQKQFPVLWIRLLKNIKRNKCTFRHGDHIVKTQDTKPATVQFQNVFAWFNFCVIWLWGLHGDKVTVAANIQDHSNIRTAKVFVILDTAIHAVKKMYVVIINAVDTKVLHFSFSLYGLWRDIGTLHPAIFNSLLNGKGFPL